MDLPGPDSQTEERRQLKNVGAKVQRYIEDRHRGLGERTGIEDTATLRQKPKDNALYNPHERDEGGCM